MKNKKMIIVSAIACTFILWMIWGNASVGVTHYTVSDNKLPTAFNHYKIAVVSDLHNAEFGKENRTIVNKIRKEQPDMIAITGDLVDSSRTDAAVAVSLAEELVQIAPCYYVTGNHEAWIGAKYAELEEKLTAAGVNILHDAAAEISKDGETIRIVGVDDPDFTGEIQKEKFGEKLQQLMVADGCCLLLSHRPELFETYVSEHVNLVLSGHAHGGQFRIPFAGGLVAPNQGFFPKYDGGRYIENSTTMIVSRGIGNSIIPVRFNNRPEIVMVELECQ